MRLALASLLGLAAASACSANTAESGDTIGVGASPTGQAGSLAVASGGSSAGTPANVSGGTAQPAGGVSSSGGTPASSAGVAAGGSPVSSPPGSASVVRVSARQLLVGKRQADGSVATPTPYRMKCVGWSPTGIGETNTQGYTRYYTKYAAAQVPVIADLAANTVKTYSPFETNASGLAILDAFYARGVMVVLNVMPSQYDFTNDAFVKTVQFFKNHPAILMWQVGNEINLNNLYGLPNVGAAISMAAQAVTKIHAADPDHPVSVSWGNAPDSGVLGQLSQVDIWSLNIYPWLDMSSRLSSWGSPKPMFIGEYGADAYNAAIHAEDGDSQADADGQLTDQIQSRVSPSNPNQPTLGGCVFNLTDEWWKAKEPGTSPQAHDAGGFNQSGVYPDGVANEEWWGILTVDLKPRKAYTAIQQRYSKLQ